MGIEHPSLNDPILPACLDRTGGGSALIGRKREIETLCAALTRAHTTSRTPGQGKTSAAACIWGQDGMGKTALALDVAHRVADCYPDGPIYLDLKGSSLSPLSTYEALTRLIHVLAPQDEVCEDADELAARLWALYQDRRFVLILDDVAHSAQVRPLLPPPGSAVLVTARRALDALFPEEGEAERDATPNLQLASLRHQDARVLLARFAPHWSAEPEPLVHVCRGVPLALCLVGSVLAFERGLDLESYLHRSREAQARLPPVEAVLQVSLSLESTERQAQWRTLALLHGFDAATAASVWGVETSVAEKVLCAFLSRGLIEPSPISDRRWLGGEQHARRRMHKTLRAYALSTMEETQRARDHLRVASHGVEVLRTAARFCVQEDESLLQGLALLDLEWDNIHDGQAWAAQALDRSHQAGQLCSAYADVGGRCLDWRAPLKTQIRWLYDAVRSAREWVKPDAEIRHLGRLAALYRCQDKVDQAMAHYRQALSVAQQVKNRPAESELLGSLGLLFSDLGDHERAFGHFQQALNVAQALDDRESEGNWWGNLGSAYSALGEVEQALRCHQRALDIARERGDRRGEAIWLGNLGNSHMAMGEPRAAVEAYRRAIEIACEISDRGEQARMWGNLGNACCVQNETGEALIAYENALQIARELEDRGGEGIWLLNKSLVLNQEGRRSEAIACAEAARDALREAGSAEVKEVEALLERWR
jgi:tetratricopeptide (TPR) repeat protein